MKMRTLFTLALLMAATSATAQVKLGTNDVCYSSNDPYYSQVHTSRVYMNMLECENAGGIDRMTAESPDGQAQVVRGRANRGTVVSSVAPTRLHQHGIDAYEASFWAPGLEQHSCREPRDTLLAQLSAVPVEWNADKCQVTFGHWRDFVTGARLTDPTQVELFHMVPLDWASARGAIDWHDQKRTRFYTDPRNLMVTTPQGRAQFENKTPIGRNVNINTTCQHMNATAILVQDYGIPVSASEMSQLQSQIHTHCAAPTAAQIQERKHAQSQQAQASQERFQQQYEARQNHLRSMTHERPMAPTHTDEANGYSRSLTAQERWGLDPRAHVFAPHRLPQEPDEYPAFAIGQGENVNQGLPKPPIALPQGTFRTQGTVAEAEQGGRIQPSNAQERSAFGAEQASVGEGGLLQGGRTPGDNGDFLNIPMSPELEEFGRIFEEVESFPSDGTLDDLINDATRETGRN